jgi:hypothetical protein
MCVVRITHNFVCIFSCVVETVETQWLAAHGLKKHFTWVIVTLST